MKKIVSVIIVLFFSSNLIYCQEETAKENKYLVGFNFALATGIQPSTALTDASFGEPLDKSYGFGVIIQRKITQNINIFFDANMYNYNMLLANQGDDVSSSWTTSEGATHWDEPGAPQILYVHNLPTDVHFDMQTTGLRLGLKYILSNKKFQPWVGAAYGFYKWEANYFNENKDQSYGSDDGTVLGLTALGGIDFKLGETMVISAFADVLSPIASYSIDGLFYPQWNITDRDSPIFGQYRFGVTLSFAL